TGWNNSSGLCAACNYAKELAGWGHKATPDGLEVVTPTGHHYRSRTKPISRPDPRQGHDEDAAEATSGHPSDTGPPGETEDTDSVGTDAGSGSTGSDPPRTVLIPWRFRPRRKSTVEVARTTIGVEIFDADNTPLSPVEAALRAGISKHLGRRGCGAATRPPGKRAIPRPGSSGGRG